VLIALPLIEYALMHRMEIRLVIFGVGTGLLILHAILPRRDRFIPPGPEVLPSDQPRLHELVASVARDCEQPPPERLFLIPDVNAWVARRGGLAGIGARRMMGIGLPLLQVLDVGQLRAVLAHEFGHYWNGDTHLGPWIYGTRQSLVRTVAALSRKPGFLQKIFVWYGNHYMRLTMSMSRSQELAADRLSARVAGAESAAAALVRIARAGSYYAMYWGSELAPAIRKGVRPPILEGFQRFLTRLPIEGVKPVAPEDGDPPTASPEPTHDAEPDAHDASAEADIYDTHPPLHVRLAALGVAAPVPRSGAPAIDLLRDPSTWSDAVFAPLLRQQGSDLQPIAWEDYGSRVLVPIWRDRVRAAKSFAGRTVSELAALAADPAVRAELAHVVLFQEDVVFDREIPPVLEAQLAGRALGAALGIALFDIGFRIEATPGALPEAVRDGVRVEPYAATLRLFQPDVSREDWLAECRRLGVADAVIASPVPPPAAGPLEGETPRSTRRKRRRF
jgi:heat shock protein HtpX